MLRVQVAAGRAIRYGDNGSPVTRDESCLQSATAFEYRRDKVRNAGGLCSDKVREVGGLCPDKVREVGGLSTDKVRNVGGLCLKKVKEVGGLCLDKVSEVGGFCPDKVRDCLGLFGVGTRRLIFYYHKFRIYRLRSSKFVKRILASSLRTNANSQISSR